jgi:hypothetical protein
VLSANDFLKNVLCQKKKPKTKTKTSPPKNQANKHMTKVIKVKQTKPWFLSEFQNVFIKM